VSPIRPEELIHALRGQRVLLTGPTETDGDSVGACIAFRHLLGLHGIEADIAGDPGPRYAWMPGAASMIPDAKLRGPYAAVVVLDGDKQRLPPRTTELFQAAHVRGIVDHHASTHADGYTHAWLEPQATSTCEMVYDALCAHHAPHPPALDTAIATALYVGSIFDTGAFRFSNTTPATHRMAAALLSTGIDHALITVRVLMQRRPAGMRAAGFLYTHAEFHCEGRLNIAVLSDAQAKQLDVHGGDLEGIIDGLLYVEGVEVAAMISERGNGRVKVSFRSRGRVNVAAVASSLSAIGGGHVKAAGATLPWSLSESRERVIAALASALPNAPA
jgi:phosphoesterase RecJ-like protein